MEEDYVMIPGSGTKKIIRDVKKEIETAFLDYSMSVIVSRALPDVRDGLKPVHRRILYTMHERGNDPSHAYRKSADTVGAVLGSYHPHGDASVYDAMVRLAQDFSLRYPLVDGQGNFGSVDGDPPAAYRYTEARMSRMAVEMLTDIEKDTIDWDPNFDETKKEPSVLPCRFPNLLVNGSQGIAVGMATNIPPHNLSEVIDGCIAYIDNPDIDLPGLMEYIKGPDFPTAGIIMGRSGIRAAYATGRGKITLRGRATIEETKNGRTQIIITEILTELIARDYAYAVYHPVDPAGCEQPVIDALRRQGFVNIAPPEETPIYAVNMKSPIVIFRDVETTIKNPFNKNPRVRRAIYEAHNNLLSVMNHIYPGQLILSFNMSAFYNKIIKKVAEINGVSIVEDKKKRRGPYMTVPFGKALSDVLVPNTVTKSLHIEKYFNRAVKGFTIAETHHYSAYACAQCH